MLIIIAVLKTLLSVCFVVFGWAFFVIWAGLNNRDRYKNCSVCGKTISSTIEICEDCRNG